MVSVREPSVSGLSLHVPGRVTTQVVSTLRYLFTTLTLSYRVQRGFRSLRQERDWCRASRNARRPLARFGTKPDSGRGR
jgi:hypothetical protein